MADFAALTIPFSDIDRIEILVTNMKKTLSQVKSETKADYILNGTLYDMSSGKVNCHLKDNGTVIAKPNYSVKGYAWDNSQDFAMSLLPTSKSNYIACTPLIENKQKIAKLTYDKGQGGKRGRSAIGIKSGRLALYCTKDQTSYARTPEGLRDDLFSSGWESAVMLDGGGSSQCDFDTTRVLSSSRKVHHWILVYVKKKEVEKEPSVPTVSKELNSVSFYSKAKAGTKNLSNNFTVKEFACSDGSDPVFISPKLVEVLQKIREHFGKPININSGYRTFSHNKKVGGAPYSQHLYGTAADIYISGVTPKQIYDYAETLLPNTGGIGLYPTFCHVDVRETKSRF